MDKPRITPGQRSDLGFVNWAYARIAARVAGVDDIHIFSTLGRTKGLFRAWLIYSSRMMPFGTLTRRETEIVIIRVAHLRECDYELAGHRIVADRMGLDASLFDQIIAGRGDAWGSRENAIIAAVDEVVVMRNISDKTWAALALHLSERQLIAFLLLVGQYDMLATTIHTLRIQSEFEYVGGPPINTK